MKYITNRIAKIFCKPVNNIPVVGRKPLEKVLLPEQPYHSDVHLISFPKSGNTYSRMLLANALVIVSESVLHVNWSSIGSLIPDLHKSRQINQEAQFPISGLPRIMKSHSAWSNQFKRVILLVRDPIATMRSYHNFLYGYLEIEPKVSLSDFIRSEENGIGAWNDYYSNWINRTNGDQIVRFYKYEELISDPSKVLQEWLRFLGIETSSEICDTAANLSSSELCRASELQLGTNLPSHCKPLQSFTRRPRETRYLEDFSKQDIQHIRECTEDLCSLLNYYV